MNESFTSSQVSQRTGLTFRQLQWWDEQGIVVPARQGHRRLYSAKDLAELAILCDLRRRGFSLQRIRRMIGLLRREFGHRLADLLTHGPRLHLLTDGESVFLCDSERGVIDLLRNTQQPLLAICIGPILERVLAQPAEDATPAEDALRIDDEPAQAGTPDAARPALLPPSGSAPGNVARMPKVAELAVPQAAAAASPLMVPVLQAPKKSSQPVRAAGAVRVKARP